MRGNSGWSVLVAAGCMITNLSAQMPTPVFEVASIKKQSGPVIVGSGPSGGNPNGARPQFYRPNATAASLIRFAYDVHDSQIIGGPDWIQQDLFEVNARAAGPVAVAEIRLMVRSLLEQRFRMVARTEKRDMSFSALVLEREGRLGPNLEACDKAKAAQALPAPVRMTTATRVVAAGIANCQPISQIARVASEILRTPVVDGTRLSGQWSYRLYFADPQPLPPGDANSPDSVEAPPFARALQEQLGLKLEPKRGPVDVLVIASIDRPTEN